MVHQVTLSYDEDVASKPGETSSRSLHIEAAAGGQHPHPR